MTDEIEEEIQHFKTLLTPILGRFRSSASTSVQRRLIGNYGLCLKELAILWILLKRRGFNVGEHRDRMLWALHWLRSYGTEEQCVTHFRPPPSEKTFRDAVKQFVEYFASLELV